MKTIPPRWDRYRISPPVYNGGRFYLGGIKWRIIGANNDNSKWLAISDSILERAGYDYFMTWFDAMDYCNTVYNVFSDAEKALVELISKDEDELIYKYESAEITSSLKNARVFLLSMAEANWYFSDRYARRCNPWWLRSLAQSGYYVCCVDDGYLRYGASPDDSDHGCRPALVLNTASVLFTSAAEGGKSSVAAGSGEFGEFRALSNQASKLTLQDSSRSGFSASQTGAVCRGGSLSVQYQNAPTGTNEYVSAMICDASGTPLYYASVPSGGSGTMKLTVPTGLAVGGNYTLKVFSEQQNGDYATDYASSFRTFTLNVAEAYTATFKNYDGTILQEGIAAAGEIPVYEGNTPAKPSDDPRNGWFFIGWDPVPGPIAGDTTYTAQFSQKEKNLVKFFSGIGSGTMADDSYFADEGKYTLPACSFTAPQGYMFQDWTVTWKNESGSSVNKNYMAGVLLEELTGDLTVSANWIEISIRVSPQSAGSAAYGSGAFTATANEGYTFNHWEYANDEYGSTSYGTVWPTENPYQPSEVSYKYYTAVFEANLYNLTVRPNNDDRGTVTFNGGTKTGSTITLTATPKAGYRFEKWQTEPEGIVINADNKFNMPASDVTVTAVFKPDNGVKYTVTVNNGTGGGEYAEDDDVVITANDPETGKQFKEWTGVEGLTFTSGSATTATATLTMPKHAVEATATYEDIAAVTTHTLTISYVKPDGTPAPETHTAALTKGTTYSVASPVVEGYTPDKATVSGIMGTEDISITVTYTINGTGPIKTDPAVTAPEAKADLVYNGSSQELLTAGSVDGGTMWYTLGSDATTAPADRLYTTSVPAAIEAGTYYVWYKVVGDENHNDSDPKCVRVTISATGSPDNQNPDNQNPDNQDPGKKDPNNGGNNQGGGNRKDKKTEKITITKRPSSVKAKVKKSKVTVSWKKIKKNKAGKKLLKQIHSIQIQYSTDKTFKKDVRTKTVGKKKTKVTLKLQKKTTYYIRVRYKAADGFSKWSKVKRVKTKK